MHNKSTDFAVIHLYMVYETPLQIGHDFYFLLFFNIIFSCSFYEFSMNNTKGREYLPFTKKRNYYLLSLFIRFSLKSVSCTLFNLSMLLWGCYEVMMLAITFIVYCSFFYLPNRSTQAHLFRSVPKRVGSDLRSEIQLVLFVMPLHHFTWSLCAQHPAEIIYLILWTDHFP